MLLPFFFFLNQSNRNGSRTLKEGQVPNKNKFFTTLYPRWRVNPTAQPLGGSGQKLAIRRLLPDLTSSRSLCSVFLYPVIFRCQAHSRHMVASVLFCPETLKPKNNPATSCGTTFTTVSVNYCSSYLIKHIYLGICIMSAQCRFEIIVIKTVFWYSPPHPQTSRLQKHFVFLVICSNAECLIRRHCFSRACVYKCMLKWYKGINLLP